MRVYIACLCSRWKMLKSCWKNNFAFSVSMSEYTDGVRAPKLLQASSQSDTHVSFVMMAYANLLLLSTAAAVVCAFICVMLHYKVIQEPTVIRSSLYECLCECYIQYCSWGGTCREQHAYFMTVILHTHSDRIGAALFALRHFKHLHKWICQS